MEESVPMTETENLLIERDLSFESAVSISRQWGVLLDDYRYLLEKFSNDCSCHLKFDNMFFLKGMEERYEILKKMANDNEYLSAFSNDENDWTTLNNLWENKAIKMSDSASKNYIRRITVINDDNDIVSDENVHETVPNTGEEIAIQSSQQTVRRSKRQLEKVQPNDETDMNEPESSEQLPTKVYKCEVKECDFTTMNQSTYEGHIRYHQGLSDSVTECDTVLHICQDCGKEFPTEECLKNHVQNSHVDVKIWSCEIPGCKYTTKFRSCYRDHAMRHSGKKNYHCDWDGCEKDFRTRRDLMAHIKFHHLCERRFKCDYPGCNNSFKDSNRLKHHQYIHSGERPYACKYPDCAAKFKQIPHLKKHQKIHLNKQTDEHDNDDDHGSAGELQYAVIEEGMVWQFTDNK